MTVTRNEKLCTWCGGAMAEFSRLCTNCGEESPPMASPGRIHRTAPVFASRRKKGGVDTGLNPTADAAADDPGA